MIRDCIELTHPQFSSVYILKGSESEILFKQCNPSLVKTAKEVLSNGGIIIQVYHRDFPKHAGAIFDNYDFVSISLELLHSYYQIVHNYDVWFILRFPISKEDPFAYFVAQKHTFDGRIVRMDWPH